MRGSRFNFDHVTALKVSVTLSVRLIRNLRILGTITLTLKRVVTLVVLMGTVRDFFEYSVVVLVVKPRFERPVQRFKILND